MKKLLFLAMLLLATVFAEATACPSGYASGLTISIPAQGSLSANLTNVPVLWVGDSNLVGVVTSSVGNDVIFCDGAQGSSNLLSWENVSANFNSGTGAGEFWILVPTVSKTVTQTYYAYFGKSGGADQSCAAFSNCATTVWNNYMAVFHFGTASSLSVTDSKGAVSPTNNGATATAGKIGGGAAFNGSTQYIDLGGVFTPTNTNVLSEEMWVTATSLTQNQSPLTNLQSPTFNGFMWLLGRTGSDRKLQLLSGSGGSLTGSWSTNDIGGTQTHVVMTMNGTGSAAQAIYFSGVAETLQFQSGSVGIGASSANANMGRWGAANSRYFAGTEDEVRISSNTATQTPDYILNLYTNQNAPSSYWTDTLIPPAASGKVIRVTQN